MSGDAPAGGAAGAPAPLSDDQLSGRLFVRLNGWALLAGLALLALGWLFVGPEHRAAGGVMPGAGEERAPGEAQ